LYEFSFLDDFRELVMPFRLQSFSPTRCYRAVLLLLLLSLFFPAAQSRASGLGYDSIDLSTTMHFYALRAKGQLSWMFAELLAREFQKHFHMESFEAISFSDEDLKQVVNHFDRMVVQHFHPVEKLIAENELTIHHSVVSELETGLKQLRERASDFNEADYLNFIKNRTVQNWLERYTAFLDETAFLDKYVWVIYFLEPQKSILNVTTVEEQKALQEKQTATKISSDFLLRSTVRTHEALDPDALRRYMPERFELEKLYQEESKLRTEARVILNNPNTKQYAMYIRNALRTGSSHVLRKETQFDVDENMLRELNALAGRARYSVYKQLPKGCKQIEEWYDVESIRDSQGDWKQVKHPDGSAIDVHDWIDEVDVSIMQPLYVAYLHGCFGEKNVPAAKRVLEIWANAHGDRGRIAHTTHCTLAEWEKYGIGGEKNGAAAQAWERRFLQETGAQDGCFAAESESIPVDPSDPWRILN